MIAINILKVFVFTFVFTGIHETCLGLGEPDAKK